MTTIKDVAKKAGVAISTASYALNGSSRVSDETRRKVLSVAEELNYRPNGIARNLKKQKTETIGIIIYDLTGAFFSEIIKGVQEVVYSNGYDMVACSTYGGFHNSTACRFLREKHLDGAIILCSTIPDEFIMQVARKDFPIVVLDRELNNKYVHSVLVDNMQGAYDATQHLIKLGHSEIAHLGGPVLSYDSQKRFEGYKKALIDNGIAYKPNLVVQGHFSEEGGYNAIKTFHANRQFPEAIFSANDEMAIGAIRALNEAKIRIPEDVAIVGFDDIRISSYINPSLTTVNHSFGWGTMAAHVIFQALQGQYPTEPVFLPTKLMVRKSCGG